MNMSEYRRNADSKRFKEQQIQAIVNMNDDRVTPRELEILAREQNRKEQNRKNVTDYEEMTLNEWKEKMVQVQLNQKETLVHSTPFYSKGKEEEYKIK